MTHGATLSLAVALAGCLALPTVAAARSEKRSGPHGAASPEHFIKEAASGGMAEVQLGKLAQERAASDDVKSFGKRMTDDHGKANEELERLAERKNVTLPKQVDPKHKAEYDRLSELSGTQFDRAYMDAMLQDHHHDVSAFEAATKSADPDVKAFASKTLPTLKEHLQEAQRIAGHGERRGSGDAGTR